MNLNNKITLKQGRELTGVAESTVRVQREKFNSLEKIGTTWVIDVDELQEWADNRKARELKGIANRLIKMKKKKKK